MKEFFPRKAILPSVLCLLPIGAGLLLYSRLPEQVVTHWNASGEPDGYSSRFAAVFIIPGILFLCELLVRWCSPTIPTGRTCPRRFFPSPCG